MYGGYSIAFDGKGEWNFGNGSARNVVIFGVDNSSSSHTDNPKNGFLVLSEWDTFGINGSFGAQEKKFTNNLSKERTNFCLILHYNDDNSYNICNNICIKANNKNVNLPNQFCLGSISNKFNA